MTVAELINELQRFPAHWSVLVEHPDGGGWSGLRTDIASVADVRDGTESTHGAAVLDATKGLL